jgi:tetratricopeptide (TPR) repeat protein
MAINPMRPGALFLGGWIRESLGDRVHALELYRQHLGVHPDDQMTRRREINLLVGENRMREAYQEARVAAKANPGDLDTREVEADLAFRSGEAAEGERLLGRLRAEHPDDPQVLALAVGVLSRHGRGRTGVEWAEQWSTARSGDYRAQLVAARARALNREPQQALAHYQTALRLAPDSLAPYVMLARFHQDEKRWREAEEVWTEASRRFPAENGLAFDLAGCREHLGDLTGAEHAVRDVLTREPANPSALNFLGYLWADHNMNLEEALGFILEAVGSEPGNGAYIDSLGWVYYRLGRLGDAREQLEQAVRLTGGDPVVREHLGDVYKDLKLLDLAREQYRLSAAADHDNSRVRAKLAALR